MLNQHLGVAFFIKIMGKLANQDEIGDKATKNSCTAPFCWSILFKGDKVALNNFEV